MKLTDHSGFRKKNRKLGPGMTATVLTHLVTFSTPYWLREVEYMRGLSQAVNESNSAKVT